MVSAGLIIFDAGAGLESFFPISCHLFAGWQLIPTTQERLPARTADTCRADNTAEDCAGGAGFSRKSNLPSCATILRILPV
jgi:hypothetical protein